ncbi:MCE family protein [Mycolicibacterium cosmeticum]|uniref:MCE family protein n=1 Tax=Mycolicibacterium cosmeticum TaxID=258533 RepID=UPI003204B6F4
MKSRAPLIGLSLFMTIAVIVTWLVYATLRRGVAGETTSYSAVFTDVFGLRAGDDVRMAGVRVGRVEKIELDRKQAKVEFVVQSDQSLYANTIASITYQNIIGQRYLGLSLGAGDRTAALPAGSVIPLERTESSFDVGTVLNGFEPLFSLLNPRQANDLTKGLIESLQGDQGSLTALVDRTATLSQTLSGRDQALGQLITSLSTVTSTIAAHDDDLDRVLAQAHRVITDLDARRGSLQDSVGSFARVSRRLAAATDELYPSLDQLITRQPGFVSHMVAIEPQLAFTGDNLPLLLKGFARVFGEGAYGNAYACDLNATGFFPGLNDITTFVVNAATPGNPNPITTDNLGWHTPRCRNMGNG